MTSQPSILAVKDEESTVIDRAAGFFLENNDNYNVTWEEANELISLGPNQVRKNLRTFVIYGWFCETLYRSFFSLFLDTFDHLGVLTVH